MDIQFRRVRLQLRGTWANGRKGTVIIPKHATLRIADDVIDGDADQLVAAFVGDRKLLFSAQDLRERTVQIRSPSIFSDSTQP